MGRLPCGTIYTAKSMYCVFLWVRRRLYFVIFRRIEYSVSFCHFPVGGTKFYSHRMIDLHIVDGFCRINNDWSFDDAVSSRYGCEVKAFDPRYVLKSGDENISVIRTLGDVYYKTKLN